MVNARACSDGFYHNDQEAAAYGEHQVPKQQLEVEADVFGGGGRAAREI
jgi:hypothetical protein